MGSPNSDEVPASAPTTDGPGRGETKTCPSAPCVEGAQLLGVMTGSGRLAYILSPTRVDADFVARAQAKGRPEARYRFSLPCIEAGCPQWTGDGCGVADKLVEEEPGVASTRLPTCTIRRSCRWFAEHGANACAVCPTVVADVGGTETYSTQARSAGS